MITGWVAGCWWLTQLGRRAARWYRRKLTDELITETVRAETADLDRRWQNIHTDRDWAGRGQKER